MLHRIVAAVRRELPQFNHELLVDLREREVANLIEFVAERYRELALVADTNLVLLDYRVLSPIERVRYELDNSIRKNQVNIRDDEAILVNYNFKYYDTTFPVMLYIPYIYENSSIVVGGTNVECLLNMTEKLFSVRSTSSGITIKVIRSPVSFFANTVTNFVDVVTGKLFVENVVSCKIYYKKTPATKKAKPTIIHYLLCKFTLPEVLAKFGLSPNAITFVEHETPVEGYYYFKTKPVSTNKDQIFLKVPIESMLNQRMLRDIVAALIYLMMSFRTIMFAELIVNSRMVFSILLGKLLHGVNTDRLRALSFMEKHIESVDTHLDKYTRDIFVANGYRVNDIYDVFVIVAETIGKIIISHPNNNMYNKRLEAVNNIIIDQLMQALYNRIYKYEKKKDNIVLMTQAIKKAIKVHEKHILKTLSNGDSVKKNPSNYGDNWLLTIGDKVVKRLSAANKTQQNRKSHGSGITAQVNKFHTSMMVIESAIGFSSKPGQNCLINPYAQIDNNGGFVYDTSNEEVTSITKYLANDSVTIQGK